MFIALFTLRSTSFINFYKQVLNFIIQQFNTYTPVHLCTVSYTFSISRDGYTQMEQF